MKKKNIIRPARFEDIAEILKVNQAAWDISYKGYVPDEILEERHKTFDNRVQKWQLNWAEKMGFVAEYDGKIVGEITGTLYGQTADCDCILNTLYVLPDYQKKGIGKKLIEYTIKKHHLKALNLEVRQSNDAVGFYQKMGCILTETYDTHPLGMIDVLMIREI